MSEKYKTEKDNLVRIATQQQMDAASPYHSVWVEASAGTGKTKVLSDRVFRLLLAKVNPQKILCLTYTKAAAVEMSERIAKTLSSWAVEDEEDLAKDLSKLLGKDFNNSNRQQLLNFARTLFASLLDTPGGMKIQTIHSFCQDILKRFPLEAGISPYFEIMDTRSSKEILQNIKVELLKNETNENSPIFDAISYLTQNISEFKFPEVLNLITENRSKIENLFKIYNYDISLLTTALKHKLNINDKVSETEIKQQLFNQIDRTLFKNTLHALLQGGIEDKKKAEILKLVGEHDFNSSDFDLYVSVFLTNTGKIRTQMASKAVQKLYPESLCFMNNEAQNIVTALEQIATLRLFRSTSAIFLIAKYIIDNYNHYKEIYSSLDYEDLIVITKRLLENSSVADWVLFKLDGGIEHLLIDEAQDTSPNQWAIVRALTQEFFAGLGKNESKIPYSVFVVGDRKQSIYSFQGADPKEFDKMYHYFEQRAQNFSKIRLDVSFRSTKAIMDCVNSLFNTEIAKKGVLPHNEQMNHCPFRLGDGGKVEIYPLTHLTDKPAKDKYNWVLPVLREQKTSPSAILAKQIAQNIKSMVQNKEILASKNRPIRYGDFMFLVQQRKSFVEEFIRACKEIGVNVAGVDKLKLLEQISVQDLISLGKFILLPYDDLSLAEVLKSPIFGLNDDDLFNLCYQRKTSLFNSLLQNEKYQAVAHHLKELLNMSGYIRPFELYNYVLVTIGARKNFISRMGKEVEDVLDEFLNLTIQFEQKHIPSLENFILWIEQDEVIIQKEMEQGDNDTVKIMTVHGSKGLQAPIVILADTTKIKNTAQKSDFLWDDELVYFPLSSKDYEKNCQRIKQQNNEADFNEYRRLLYVALTRAEDRLYIAGFSNSEDISEDSWYNLLSQNIKPNIPQVRESDPSVYEIPQENTFEKSVKQDITLKSIKDYSYLLTPAPIENPLAKPYAPSKDESDEVDIVASPLAENGNFYKRGTVIHKLLQYIGSVNQNEREEAIKTFLIKNLPDFSAIEHSKIVKEIIKLLDTYPDIFIPTSMAEVPIIGELDGKIISAKIDRLVVLEDKVIIVDYKTNRPAASCINDVPEIYLSQLATYRQLLEKIYPDKQIETYLLWTNTCYMMKI